MRDAPRAITSNNLFPAPGGAKRRLAAALAFTGLAALMLSPAAAQPTAPKEHEAASRAHVYLLRGLMNIFSLGMDQLAAKIAQRGIPASVHNHAEAEAIVAEIAAHYRAGDRGPIILIGHSLGADAVMEMADYLGDKSVPVALVVPFDGTQSFPASGNVARVVNFTQRDYAHMRKGPGFRGSLVNVDLSGDPSIDHLNIDKSPRLHARVIEEVLAIAGGRAAGPAQGKHPAVSTPPRATEDGVVKPQSEAAGPVGAKPNMQAPPARAAAPEPAPPRLPPARGADALQIPD